MKTAAVAVAAVAIATAGVFVASPASTLPPGVVATELETFPVVTVTTTATAPTTTATTTAQPTVCSYVDGGALPDPACTPGALNPAVTQTTIHTTICVTGWTATIRPPVTVTAPEKLASMRQYGVTDPALYEYDHLVALELGGAANSTLNLWPEPHTVTGNQGSFVKDGIENRLRSEVCAGTLTLAAAQTAIRTDWRTAP